MKNFYFKDRDGQTPLPEELRKGLLQKTIQSIGELDEFEEDNIASGLIWLEKYKRDDYLTHTFWVKLHKKLFDKVWKWAGKIRENELQNPYFKMPHQIRTELKKLEDDIQYWISNNTYNHQELAARFHERIETIHPFPNGNGRFGRIITEYICERQNVEVPKWGDLLKDKPTLRRSEYIAALNKTRETKRYDDLIKFMFS